MMSLFYGFSVFICIKSSLYLPKFSLRTILYKEEVGGRGRIQYLKLRRTDTVLG